MTRAEAMQPADAAAGFDALVAGLREQRDQVSTLRPELSFEDVPAPRTLAPFAAAMAATVLDGDTDIASGRLVLLYDPAGQDGWGGPLRIIVYVRADLDPEIAADPLIGQVGWDWLTEALDNRTAGYGQPSGTVTRVVTEGFGAKESEPAVTGFELRASWSPAEPPSGPPAGTGAGTGAGPAAGTGAGPAAGPGAGPGGEGPLDGHLAAWCDAL
ncbi:MAG TPA: DUF3000 family protein, partial [Streptosporangiaceae bacterium]